MERLTHKTGINAVPTKLDLAFALGMKDGEFKLLCDILNRLAAYEDTGLEPEEINALCSMSERAKMAEMLRTEEYFGISADRLHELAQADKESRVVVLPCKVGDTIYRIHSKVNHDLNILAGHPENNRVYAQVVKEIDICATGFLIITCDGLASVHSQFFGETWFLTPEEAAAALEAMKERAGE